jgi:ABC-type microcin C transport system permease subunit YejB
MYMFKYICKRIGLMLMTFAIIFTVCFVLIKLLPVDTTSVGVGEDADKIKAQIAATQEMISERLMKAEEEAAIDAEVVEEAVENATDAAEEKAEEIAEEACDKAEEACEKAEEVCEKAEEKVEEVKEAVEEAAE